MFEIGRFVSSNMRIYIKTRRNTNRPCFSFGAHFIEFIGGIFLEPHATLSLIHQVIHTSSFTLNALVLQTI